YWKVHQRLNLDDLTRDPQTLGLVNFDLCIQRAGTLLLLPPSPQKLAEANRLLDLVESQQPALRPSVDYWRAVAMLPAKQAEPAAAVLGRVLDPATYGAENLNRQAILLTAWQLALLGPDEMKRRVGQPQLAQPGRRMEAIAAVERRLGLHVDDADAWALKRLL